MPENKYKNKVGVLRGGTDKFYEDSLQDGGEVITNLSKYLGSNWKVFDILIDKKGVWHFAGLPIKPTELAHKVDVIWNTSSSEFSQILKNLGIPYFGLKSFSESLCNSKQMLKEHMEKIGVNMPRHLILSPYKCDIDGPRERYSIKKAKEVFEKFGAPWTIQSLTTNSNMAIHVANTFPELVDAIEDGVSQGVGLLVEECIKGREAQVHILPGFRGENIYTFPVGNFRKDEKEKIDLLSRKILNHVGSQYYLKTNFKLDNKGKIYFIGLELMPSLKTESHFYSSCESVGVKQHQIVEHILKRVLDL
ncbi:MAG TPA: hypothetical protein PKZ36_02280 [Candidatus Paceibacterota bacterium]|nr:hypothetical protein [Candidatus Paceibacterota bacterium]HPT18210.1 hypothetical protein [Candidatus Paceibacterota bacterium]